MKDAPRPRVSEGGALSSRESRVNQAQAVTLLASAPWHRAVLVIQPASRTSFRLACVIGFGVRRIELRLLLPGVVNLAVPVTLLGSEFLQSWIAASPAVLPSRRESFHTSTVCVPTATRLRAAWSPSCPDTGTLPERPCALSAAITPPAMPSFSERTASTLFWFCVRICSMLD